MDLVNEGDGDNNKSVYWIYFFRQLFSCSALVLNFFMFGLYMGAPTVIIPQMRKDSNIIEVITPDMISWLSSISAYSALPWGIILPILAYRFGRKILLTLINLNVLAGNILFYYSTSVTELIVSQAMQGMLIASVTTVTIMVMSEYTSPKYRGIFLTVKSATFFWGIWVSNAIGTFFHWRIISIVIFICIICNSSSIFCCESPYWLATKGRFEECAKIHRWLKGTDDNSERELNNLILLQKKHLSNKAELNGRIKGTNKIKILDIIRLKSFYKPLFCASLPIFLYNLSGKIAYTVYAIDIIKKMTSNEKMAYEGMLLLDGVTVLGMYLGCALCKIVTRRTQMLVFSSIGVAFLYILSLYLSLINLNIITENKYVSILFLMGFSISISCGPIILSTCCAAELAPLRYRSYFLCSLSLMTNVLFATVLKITPLVFKLCGTNFAFLFYAVTSSFFILLLYKYLPETKDKTIQEIQELISGDDRYAPSKLILLQDK